MNTSKLNSRCRPALGTLVRVQVSDDQLFEPIFSKIAEVEAIFNFFDESSELNQFNQDPKAPLSDQFSRLLNLALALREASDCAFTPYIDEQAGKKLSSEKVDLGGLAKGFAVDQAVEEVQKKNLGAHGFIECGGDIRYFGKSEEILNLRLGVPPFIFNRELKLVTPHLSVATSSPGLAQEYGESKTTLAAGKYPAGATVTVIAESCALADALTKVLLFGKASSFKKYPASAFVFDREGQLIESFGA